MAKQAGAGKIRERKNQEKKISSIGRALKAWRTENGHSQSYVSEKLGIAQSSVTLFEQGFRRPELDLVVAIAKLIGSDQRAAVIDHLGEDLSTMPAAEVLSRQPADSDVAHVEHRNPIADMIERLPAKEQRLVVELVELLSRPHSSLMPMVKRGADQDDGSSRSRR